VERGVIGSGDIIVLVSQPSVPFRGNHVAIGAAHRQVVIVLNPSSLVAVCIHNDLHKGSKSS
jgi:hypothetical protein